MNLFYNIPQSFHPETRHSIRKVMERFVSESFQDDNIVDIPSLNRTTATLALIAATSFWLRAEQSGARNQKDIAESRKKLHKKQKPLQDL